LRDAKWRAFLPSAHIVSTLRYSITQTQAPGLIAAMRRASSGAPTSVRCLTFGRRSVDHMTIQKGARKGAQARGGV
jgi:hypothetical protein